MVTLIFRFYILTAISFIKYYVFYVRFIKYNVALLFLLIKYFCTYSNWLWAQFDGSLRSVVLMVKLDSKLMLITVK